VKLGDVFQYIINLQIKDADVAKFLQDAGTKAGNERQACGNHRADRRGGLPTIVGNGRMEIDGGQLTQIPILNLLATLLQMDALRNLKFSECVMEYSISNNVMQTPVIRIISPELQITGKGSVSLATIHSITI